MTIPNKRHNHRRVKERLLTTYSAYKGVNDPLVILIIGVVEEDIAATLITFVFTEKFSFSYDKIPTTIEWNESTIEKPTIKNTMSKKNSEKSCHHQMSC